MKTMNTESLSNNHYPGFSYPVNPIYRNYLIISSCFFFAPASYAIINAQYVLCFFSFTTGCASINFWWVGIPNWRLKLDKWVAYMTTIVYLSLGFYHTIQNYNNGKYLFPLLYLFFTFSSFNAYFLSCAKWEEGNHYWYYYHIFFHLFLSIGKILIIEEQCSMKEVIFSKIQR